MRVLVVHNRYRSAQPSGENAVVDVEAELLAASGCTVERLEVGSDEIATWSPARRALLPARIVWSLEGRRLTGDAVERFGPDVVHVHNTFPLLSPTVLRAAHASRAAVVQTLHNFRPLCADASFLRDGLVCESCLGRSPLPGIVHGCYRGSALKTLPVAALIATHRALGTWRRCVDLFVCPSEFARGKYVEAGWDAERIVVKPNTARDPGEPAETRGGLVCVARLTAEKGVDVLVEAWRHAGAPQLTVVGDGDDAATLRAAGEGISFLGQLPREDVTRVVATARAVVIPSRCYEVFPRTLVEAYAAGVPVVASRIGSLAELVEHERTGLLVEPNDPGDLARALRRIEDEPGLAERLGRAARGLYEFRYSPAATTAQLLDVYRRALALKSAAAARPVEAVT